MTDRPTEQDLALDAIDDAFKGVIGQYTKDKINAEQLDIAGGVRKALVARKAMISIVATAINGKVGS